ncbi:carboxylate--amine ligase [Natrialba sp. PRR66]|uniref:carboxylate--amine ligase n=1 Tax=Natrialba sp. PRR66 TaxID=3098146 RepID=UPI002B1D8879|nr:carboxylate--amine ligase [Natrialba sp. PRR66]
MRSNAPGECQSVVVPGITAPSSVACVRSLARRGIRTIVVSSDERTPAAKSRYCDEAVVVPSPYEDLLAYRDALQALAMRPDVRTIIPVREPDVYVLSKYRDEFSEHIGTPWPEMDTLARAQDRVELFEAAANAGVGAPETVLCTELPESGEWIVKPRYSVLGDEYLDRYGPETCIAPPSTRYLETESDGTAPGTVAAAAATAGATATTSTTGTTRTAIDVNESVEDGSSNADAAVDSTGERVSTTSSTVTASSTATESTASSSSSTSTTETSASATTNTNAGTSTNTNTNTNTNANSGTADAPSLETLRTEMGHTPIRQEYVPTTDEYGFFALYDRGEPVATFQHRQRRGYSYAGGPSSYRESVWIPELERAGRALLDHLEWHGLAMVEFLRDEETGEFKLMEVNPRFWSSLPFSVQTGADFPYYYWLLAGDERERIDHDYEVGIGGHLVRGELLHLYSILTADVPLVEKPPFRTALWDICRSMATERRCDYLSRDDPRPFVRDLANAATEFDPR